jgi:hypothetical protein
MRKTMLVLVYRKAYNVIGGWGQKDVSESNGNCKSERNLGL